jgi:signal transduction histidine kinase/ActR/RegA family two-component response regulator
MFLPQGQEVPMRKWSQQLTLNVGLVVIGLLAIVSSGAFLVASKYLARDLAVLSIGGATNVSDSRTLRLAGLQELSSASTALLTGETRYAQAARSWSSEVRAGLARLQTQIADPEGRFLVGRVRATERDYRQAFDEAASSSGGPDLAVVATRGQVFEQALNDLETHTAPAASVLATARASMGRTQAVLNAVATVSIVVALILCTLILLVINRNYGEQSSERLTAARGQSKTTADLNEAKAAIQLKDRFLATISHELRNPLAPILTWTQLLRGGTLGKKKADRGLEMIERNVISLSELIDDLVDVSRVVAGKFRLDVRPIDLTPLIRAAVESQRPASDAKQIRLQLVLDERAGLISGDSERLQQVMANLLSNAIKFTPKGGSVQVVLRRAESHIELAVADSGIGIEPAFLPHVFEPFKQAMEGPMRRHAGLGLGLSIVRHIIELHGGEITVSSEGAGRGTRFEIVLPLLGTGAVTGPAPPSYSDVTDGPGSASFGRLDRIRVLLVDDEPTANEATETLLDSCGAEVRVAGSAAQALQVIDTWKPDVLISDIAMPEEDGYVLIKRIRARNSRQGGDTPAVALTAYASPGDRVNILAAGFQMYLVKPADPGELVAVVASLAAPKGRSSHGASGAPISE